MKCIGPGINSVNALRQLETINKSSKGFSSSAKRVLALEIATIKDATSHGWQAVIGMPSAALNGHLSDQARHLWYTFTHLAFAAIVPFTLFYPSSASTAAHALQLSDPCPQAPTGVIAKMKDVPMQVLQQGKLWSARIPSSLKFMAMCVSLIGLGFLASQIAYSQPLQQIACPQPLQGKCDQEEDGSENLQTALYVSMGIQFVVYAFCIAGLVKAYKALSDGRKVIERHVEFFKLHGKECKGQCEACVAMIE